MNQQQAQAARAQLPVWVKTYGGPRDDYHRLLQTWNVHLSENGEWHIVEERYLFPKMPYLCLDVRI